MAWLLPRPATTDAAQCSAQASDRDAPRVSRRSLSRATPSEEQFRHFLVTSIDGVRHLKHALGYSDARSYSIEIQGNKPGHGADQHGQ